MLNEPTQLFESPFTSVSTVSRGYNRSLVSLFWATCHTERRKTKRKRKKKNVGILVVLAVEEKG
jgi:hypothetical protein